MKRLLAILAIIAVLCTFCTVAAMAAEEAPVAVEQMDTPTIDGSAIEENQMISVSVKVGDVIELHTVDTSAVVEGSYVAPTCTEEGKVNLYCTDDACAAQNLWHTVTIDALGHDWSTVVNTWGDATTVPTCQLSGEAVEVCERCGAEGEHRELVAIPHDFTKKVVDVDNCLEYTYHLECSYGCGTVYTEPDENGNEQVVYYTEAAKPYEDGDLAGELKHDWTDWSIDVEPTCCEKGTMTRACTICGAKQALEIEKLDHTYAIVDQHLDSCEQITVTYQCTDPDCECDATFTETITGDFHQYVPAEGATDTATCTENGTLKLVCKYCDAEKLIPTEALGHAWGEWTLEKTFVKDGEEVGYYRHVCERCGYAEEIISAESPEQPADPVDPVDPDDPVVENIYAISTANVTVEETAVSGTGTLVVIGEQEVGEMYARVAVVYENEAGEQILVVNVAEIKADNTFKIPSVKAPYGYTVKQVCLVAVTDDAAVEGAWSDYAVSDPAVL